MNTDSVNLNGAKIYKPESDHSTSHSNGHVEEPPPQNNNDSHSKKKKRQVLGTNGTDEKMDTGSVIKIESNSEDDDDELVHSEELSKLVESGLSLDIDLPELPRLRNRLLKVWQYLGN